IYNSLCIYDTEGINLQLNVLYRHYYICERKHKFTINMFLAVMIHNQTQSIAVRIPHSNNLAPWYLPGAF
ncbi:hypothetical protein L4D08_18385, partial [Photobacterium chitinilyticum]|uniref:hypothetical protein n=1 Tax=Photobacterium chitinilyticum TaxID=2485123 RepID=UPI003D0E7698